MLRIAFASLLGLSASVASTALRAADAEHPTVIELFQSQGCSSCPPANASLIEFVKRPNVIALTFAVDYWDRLGWKDTFASPAYTARQYAYARSLGGDGVYTPEIVVNGRAAGVGDTVAEMEALAKKTDRGASGPSLSFAAGSVVVSKGAAPAAGADVWLALYDPKVVEVPVARGENAGRTLAHTHVVHGLTRLGHWTGEEARFALPASAEGYARAVLVQSGGVGPILAAGKV
jgi:hypothetical protein